MSSNIFPSLPGIQWDVKRSPAFATTIVTNYSGKEIRIARQAAPRRTFELSFELLRQGTINGVAYTEQAQLEGFFNGQLGPYDSFLYLDPDDNAVTGQTIGVGDGATVQFQLIRPYGGANEPILAPATVSNLTVGGVAKTNGSDYGVGGWENGVTPPGTINFFTGAPSAGAHIVCDFTFHFPVRFTEDTITFSKLMQSRHENKKVAFIQIL